MYLIASMFKTNSIEELIGAPDTQIIKEAYSDLSLHL